MNTISEVDNQIHCSCGAKALPKDRNRFLKRHPKICSDRAAYNHQLAGGTKSVILTDPEEDKYKYWAEVVNSEGRNLSEWETDFMKSVTDRIEKQGSFSLSSKQRKYLEKIYSERTA
jgi:hypothetical protein